MARFACPSCSLDLSMPEEQTVPPATCPRCHTPLLGTISETSEAIKDRPSVAMPPPFSSGNRADHFALPEHPSLEQPAYRFYSPFHVIVATFLGGPLGGFGLMALNYARLRLPIAAWGALATGIIATALSCLLGYFGPERAGFAVIGFPTLLGTGLAAQALQGAKFRQHTERGGKPASVWAAIGVGLASLALILISVFSVVMVVDEFNGLDGPKVSFPGGEEIIYIEGASEADARNLGTVLKQDGFFTGGHPKTVRITRPKNKFVVAFVLQKDAWNDPEVVEYFQQLRLRLLADPMYAGPVRIELCDDQLVVRKAIE